MPYLLVVAPSVHESKDNKNRLLHNEPIEKYYILILENCQLEALEASLLETEDIFIMNTYVMNIVRP